jgi:hypothetical protein
MTFCARKNALYVCWTSTRVRTIGLTERNRCNYINKNMIISHEDNVMPNALTSGAVVCIYLLVDGSFARSGVVCWLSYRSQACIGGELF